jgi:hypothetical protein
VIRRSCGFETEPTLVASRLKDRRHTVMDLTHQLVGRHRDDGEGAFAFSSARIAQFSHKPARPKGVLKFSSLLHAIRTGEAAEDAEVAEAVTEAAAGEVAFRFGGEVAAAAAAAEVAGGGAIE